MSGIRYELLPETLRAGSRRYIEEGIKPGSFLTAVIQNDLREACAMADGVNRHLIFEIVSWWYNEAPGPCWGSPKRMEEWMANDGLKGRMS